MKENFNKWFYEVCEHLANKQKGRTPHDIAPLINMTEAKLAFMEGQLPEEFELW